MTDSNKSIQREQMDIDVLIVGAGSAGLSAAIHLLNLVQSHNKAVGGGQKSGDLIEMPVVAILEKGSEVGAHSVSGAVIRPDALRELISDYAAKKCPIACEVRRDSTYFLTASKAIRAPITPPPFRNKGNYIVSLSQLNRWLASQAESLGANVFAGFAAVEALYRNQQIVGVRTGDKGLDKNGHPKSNFEPGMILNSKVTIFSEGTRGSLIQTVEEKLNLREGKNAEVFEEGVKEIIQMPEGQVSPGHVIHTLGFPYDKTVGGGFIYTMPGDKISLGVVGYLNTKDPFFDPHRDLQIFKTHPFVYDMIKGGKVIAYGGKTIPAGGWYSMPKLFGDGFLICGDSASMVDVKKLKGVHLAMKSGMLAAETVFEALIKNDFSRHTLRGYEQRVIASYVKKELYKVRNFHQSLSDGLFYSMPAIMVQEITGGAWLQEMNQAHEKDFETTESVLDVWGPNEESYPDRQLPKPDGVLFFDKLSSVYLTGTQHNEDSPNHLLLGNGNICQSVCYPKHRSPCTHFCPANVYEMVDDENSVGQKKLQINFTNCIHCKTCDIKCTFDNIVWTTPEGGGGPNYVDT